MELQRKLRKHTEYMANLKRRGAIVAPILFATVAVLVWQYVSILACTVLMVVSIFSLLLSNPSDIRRYAPGVNSKNPIVRALSALLYLSAVLAVISLAGS